MNHLAVGITIRSIRLNKNIKNKHLCLSCDLEPWELSRIEKGKRKLQLVEAMKIAKFLGTSMNELCSAIAKTQAVLDQK